jgi:hypothetical protein
MVEGIVIMTTMLVFLGTNVWAAKAYGGKLDQASETRRDVLYYASHACEATVPGSAVNSSGQAIDPTGSSDALSRAANQAGQTGNGAGAAVNRSWNTASEFKETTVSGYAVVTTPSPQRSPLSATLRTGSWATCNEKRYDRAWSALFEFGWSFLKSGAGLG